MKLLRLFVEGVEIPVESGTITSRINSPAIGQFSIPPAANIRAILPRSLVVAAVHKTFLPEEKWEQISDYYSNLIEEQFGPGNIIKASDFEDYFVIFVGESMNFGLAKTTTSAHSSLTAVDFTNWLDYLYEIMYTINEAGVKTNLKRRFFFGRNAAPGDNPKLDEDCDDTVKSVLYNPSMEGWPECRDALYNQAKLLDPTKKIKNEDLIRTEIGAEASSKDEDDAFLKQLLEDGFMKGTLPEGCDRYRKRIDEVAKKLKEGKNAADRKLALCIEKYAEKMTDEDFSSAASEFYISEQIDGFVEIVKQRLTQKGTFGHNLRALLKSYLNQQYIDRMAAYYANFVDLISVSGRRSTFLKKFMDKDYTDKFFKNALSSSPKVFTLRTILGYVLGLLNHEMVNFGMPIVYKPSTRPLTAFQFFVKPETIFYAVPACNVIYPEEYETYSLATNPAGEPTRGYFRAPTFFTEGSIDTIQGQMTDIEYIIPQDIYYESRPLTLEEMIRGPVYMQQDFNFYMIDALAYGLGTKKKKKKKETEKKTVPILNPTAKDKDELWEKIEKQIGEENETEYTEATLKWILSQIAAYTFFKQKTAQRSIGLSITFNPFILTGEPALLVYYPKEGGHMVGYVVQTSHMISQQGARTSISLTNVRTYDEPAMKIGPAQNFHIGSKNIDYWGLQSLNLFSNLKADEKKNYFSDLYWGHVDENVFPGTEAYIGTRSVALIIDRYKKMLEARKSIYYTHNEDLLASKAIPILRLSDFILYGTHSFLLMTEPVTMDEIPNIIRKPDLNKAMHLITARDEKGNIRRNKKTGKPIKYWVIGNFDTVSQLKRYNTLLYRRMLEYNRIKEEK